MITKQQTHEDLHTLSKVECAFCNRIQNIETSGQIEINSVKRYCDSHKSWNKKTCTISKTVVLCFWWMLSIGCIGSLDNSAETMHFITCLRQTILDSNTAASNVIAALSANELEALIVRRHWDWSESCKLSASKNMPRSTRWLERDWLSPDTLDESKAVEDPGLNRPIMHFPGKSNKRIPWYHWRIRGNTIKKKNAPRAS